MLGNPFVRLGLVYLAGLVCLLVLAWQIGAPFPASLTTAEKKYLSGKDRLVFVADVDFAPHAFYDAPSGRPSGYEIDLVDKLRFEFQTLQVDVELLQLPRDEAMQTVLTGQADVLTGMSISSRNLQQFTFTQPYLYASYSLVYPNGTVPVDLPLSRLGEYRITTEENSATNEILAAHLSQPTIVQGKTPGECLQLLEAGDADIWFEYRSVASHILSGSNPRIQLTMRSVQDIQAPYAMAVAKDNGELKSILDKVFVKMTREGFFGYLDQKWFGLSLDRAISGSQIPLYLVMSAVPIYTLVCLVVFWNTSLRHQVKHKTAEIAGLYAEVKQSLEDNLRITAAVIDARDAYTAQHSFNVALISTRIAKEMQLPRAQIDHIYVASLLHDLGKIGVPDEILRKSSILNPQEYGIIKEHSNRGFRILKKARGSISTAAEIVLSHHERYDGSGYPNGIRLTDIPTAIVAFADALDAMTTARPYRKPLSNEEVLEQIKKGRGKQFHPLVVDSFLHLLRTSTGSENVYEFIVKVKLNFAEMEKVREANAVQRLVSSPSGSYQPLYEKGFPTG